jgi:hypothetical protein
LSLLRSPSFWIFAVLCLIALWFILAGTVWMVWVSAFFLLCLLIASVIGMISFPVGRDVAFVAFIVCLAMSALLWLRHGSVLIV